MGATDVDRWPSIPVADWQDTRDTLHRYAQVVGKARMANEPLVDHWWNIPLHVSARGLTTSPMPHPTGPALQIDLDFVDHRLDILTERGLVKKEKCDSDRHGCHVVVTARGRREIEAAAPGHVAAVRRLFVDRLTSEHLDAVGDAAEGVLATLDESGEVTRVDRARP